MMRKYLVILIVPLLVFSCKKSSDTIVWEKSYGPGKAAFIKNTGDTGYVSCGENGGRQYLLFTDPKGNKKSEYKSEHQGILTSAYAGNGFFITAGSSGGQLTISRIDTSGLAWDTVLVSSFPVEYAVLCHLGDDSFLAIGSANPDSSFKVNTGLCFLWFDKDGNITMKRDTVFSGSYVAVRSAVEDNSGNFYMALTRNGNSGKLKASVSKFNSDLERIWEKELYNNPAYGAASLSIALDDGNNPVIAGRTEMQVSTGIQNNTFVSRYFKTGDSIQKSYLEYANSGSSVIRDEAGQFTVLNSGCLIMNTLDNRMKVTGFIRTFSSCDSKTTNIFGYSMDVTGDGNLIIAGSKGSNYYIAEKSASDVSPV